MSDPKLLWVPQDENANFLEHATTIVAYTDDHPKIVSLMVTRIDFRFSAQANLRRLNHISRAVSAIGFFADQRSAQLALEAYAEADIPIAINIDPEQFYAYLQQAELDGHCKLEYKNGRHVGSDRIEEEAVVEWLFSLAGEALALP